MSDSKIIFLTPREREVHAPGEDAEIERFRKSGLLDQDAELQRPENVVHDLFPDGYVVGVGSQTTLRDLMTSQPDIFSGFPSWLSASEGPQLDISWIRKRGKGRVVSTGLLLRDGSPSDLLKWDLEAKLGRRFCERRGSDGLGRSFLYFVTGESTLKHGSRWRHQVQRGSLVEVGDDLLPDFSDPTALNNRVTL